MLPEAVLKLDPNTSPEVYEVKRPVLIEPDGVPVNDTPKESVVKTAAGFGSPTISMKESMPLEVLGII